MTLTVRNVQELSITYSGGESSIYKMFNVKRTDRFMKDG